MLYVQIRVLRTPASFATVVARTPRRTFRFVRVAELCEVEVRAGVVLRWEFEDQRRAGCFGDGQLRGTLVAADRDVSELR